jgi:2-dehydropantoate 2-reductase
MKKVMFIGMGSVGATFASQLKKGGIAPTILCNEERKKRYSENGFIVNNNRYDFEYILPNNVDYKADIIFIAVKYQNLTEVIGSMKNFVNEKTIIVSLLNGIDSEIIIGNKYGMNHMVHAFVIKINAVREKNIINFNNHVKIVFGKENGNENYQTDFIKNLFDETNINYDLSNEILKKLWWKFMVNIGLNPISAILNAPYGIFKKCKETAELSELAMMEVIKLSIAMDINLDLSAIDECKMIINDSLPDGITSMLQDVKSKRKTEIEILCGQVIKLGKKYNVDTPINNYLFKMIKSIEYINGISN